MKEKFKKMPLSVKISVVILLAFYIFLCVVAPLVTAGFTFVLLIGGSVARVIEYFVWEK